MNSNSEQEQLLKEDLKCGRINQKVKILLNSSTKTVKGAKSGKKVHTFTTIASNLVKSQLIEPANCSKNIIK